MYSDGQTDRQSTRLKLSPSQHPSFYIFHLINSIHFYTTELWNSNKSFAWQTVTFFRYCSERPFSRRCVNYLRIPRQQVVLQSNRSQCVLLFSSFHARVTEINIFVKRLLKNHSPFKKGNRLTNFPYLQNDNLPFGEIEDIGVDVVESFIYMCFTLNAYHSSMKLGRKQ